MAKLFNLKKWLTLEETAKHLSILFDEEVKVHDVLHLALDGHLQLSTNLVSGTYVRVGKPINKSDARLLELPFEINGVKFKPDGYDIGNNLFVQFEEKVSYVRGIWDLCMFGSEVLDVERVFHSLSLNTTFERVGLDGVFLKEVNGEKYIHLQENFDSKKDRFLLKNCFPALGLPDDSFLVVRTEALQILEKNLSQNSGQVYDEVNYSEKNLAPREKNNLLKIIKVLCIEQKIDLTKPHKGAAIIKNLLELNGFDLSEDTIASKLEQANKLS